MTIASITVGIVLVLITSFVVTRYYQQRKEEKVRELGRAELELGSHRTTVERMTQAWIITEDDLAFGEVIGSGASGVVHKGKWG